MKEPTSEPEEMMRRALAALAALSTLTAGCARNDPASYVSLPNENVVYIVFETHDAFDFPTDYIVEMVVDVILPPDKFGVFQDANGNEMTFPAPYADAAPITIPIFYPAGTSFSLSATGHIVGKWGDAVVCYMKDTNGQKIITTQSAGAIFDIPRDAPPNTRSRTSVTCLFTVTS